MQPGRRQRAAGTISRSQPGQGEEQPSPCLGPGLRFESCLLSFQVFGEVLSQAQLLEAGDLGAPCLPCFGAPEGAKKQLPKCYHCV